MPRRLLHFRFTFAVLACIALLAGALLETIWLVGPGAVAAAISDFIGILQARARFPLPADRALRGGAEALPALGLAALEPFAIGIAVVVVLYAAMASGIQTVGVSRGQNVPLEGAETLRRGLTSAGCSVAVVVAALHFYGQQVGMTAFQAALAGTLAAGAGAAIALLQMWLSVGKSSHTPNVDT